MRLTKYTARTWGNGAHSNPAHGKVAGARKRHPDNCALGSGVRSLSDLASDRLAGQQLEVIIQECRIKFKLAKQFNDLHNLEAADPCVFCALRRLIQTNPRLQTAVPAQTRMLITKST